MDLHIRSVDIPLTDELRAYAEGRANKLDRLIERGSNTQLELRRRPQRTGAEVTAVQVTIRSGKKLLRAEETDFDPMKAIDQAFDKMARQMRRAHDRRTDRQAAKLDVAAITNGDAPGLAQSPGVIETIEDDDEDELDAPIARTKRFTMKPMPPDEAVEQMELLGHSFFLFFNVDDDQMNVVYLRHDGSYGIIAPDAR